MMEEDVPASISIPAPVNAASSDNEELEDVQVPIEDLEFPHIEIVEPKIIEPFKPEQKESHVCIFPDCKKGKRGGTDYCIKHKKMGAKERERLAFNAAIISKSKQQLKATRTKIATKADAKSTTPKGEDTTVNVVFSIDEPSENINITGLVLVLISFLQLTIGFEHNNEIMCFLSLLFLIIGTAFLVIDSPSKLRSFNYFLVVVIAYSILLTSLFASNFSMGAGGAGLGGLSEWGGP